MRAPRPPTPEGRGWQPTQAGELSPPEPLPSQRPQPPLREVLKGLDSRELEGETVFDQLFGSLGKNKPNRQ
jgi:hypothetical protein